MNLASRIVVLGGYGNFGARIVRALASERYEVLVAGRSLAKAEALIRNVACADRTAALRAVELDWTRPTFVRQLGVIAPIVVIHAAGPFQVQDYRVAEACLACRSHYIDLADSRQFVAGIDSLDREARRRDVLLASGASTLPGISSAVVNALTADLSAISSIASSISTDGRSPRGEATIAAVLSYCGKPIRMLERGAWTVRHGWQDSRVVEYPSFRRRVAACDVPDLELFPRYYPGVETVSFHAGPEQGWQHAVLWLMAAAARLGLVGDWSRHARALARIDRSVARMGGDVGAMRIEVRGLDADGETVARAWNLTARQGHGPEVPCAPAIALARKLVAGEISDRGAKPCLGLVDMRDLELAFAPFDISWTVTEARAATAMRFDLRARLADGARAGTRAFAPKRDLHAVQCGRDAETSRADERRHANGA